MARVVGEIRPKFVFVENSPMLTTRGGTRVVGDLAEMGYDCKWTVMGAADVRANHKRDRMWIVGKLANSKKLLGYGGSNNSRVSLEQKAQPKPRNDCGPKNVANTPNQGDVWGQWQLVFAKQEHDRGRGSTDGSRKWWEVEPNVGRVADGVAARVDRLKAIGNGQVPLCAASAWRLLTNE